MTLATHLSYQSGQLMERDTWKSTNKPTDVRAPGRPHFQLGGCYTLSAGRPGRPGRRVESAGCIASRDSRNPRDRSECHTHNAPTRDRDSASSHWQTWLSIPDA